MQLCNATEWLLFHLWKKNPKNHRPCEDIYIPYTVIYRWAQPHTIFMQKDNKILKLTKENFSLEKIVSSFEQINNPICSLVHISTKDMRKNYESVEFEFLDPGDKKIEKFFYEREKELNSVVQEFILPKDNRNSNVIQPNLG